MIMGIVIIAGSGPYYDAPGGREMSRETMGGGGGGGGGGGAMEVERMDLDHGEHPVEEAALADKVNIASKLQTIDYSHGSSSYSNLKSVDYNHGSFTGSHPHGYRDPHYPPPIDRQPTYPQTYEGYSFPPGGGAFPPGPPGNFLPSGLDAATLFAAYASQAGTAHWLCLFLTLDVHAWGLLYCRFVFLYVCVFLQELVFDHHNSIH